LLPNIVSAAVVSKHAWIHQLGMCESSWRPSLKHLDSNNYYSYGALQFQMGTWLGVGSLYASTTKSNIYDPVMQEKVAIALIEKGESWRWKTCFRKTTKKLGPYPFEVKKTAPLRDGLFYNKDYSTFTPSRDELRLQQLEHQFQHPEWTWFDPLSYHRG
jgi:hypothetical protein